jgi:ribosomal protein L29
MKKKDFTKKISGKSEKELSTLITEKRLALRAFRFAGAGSNNRNVKEGNALKKDVARILTVLASSKVKSS